MLRALEGNSGGLSISALAKAVGLARSTVQRIVGALAKEGFVTAAGVDGKIRIGPGLIRIAASLGMDALALIRPQLSGLARESGETVDLSILAGGSVVFVDQILGKHRLAALSFVGARFPLHCSANGKAILATFEPAVREELIAKSLQEHAEFPISSMAKLRDELAVTRRTHLAYDLEEHGSGVCAVGTAIPGHFGNHVAVSIPVPTQRFEPIRSALESALLGFRERILKMLAA